MTDCRTSFSRRLKARRSRYFTILARGALPMPPEAAALARLTLPMAGYSPTIADFDNDGWKDIFVTRGHVQALGSGSKVQIDQPNTVFRNLGGAKFQALTEEAGLSAQPPRAAPRICRGRSQWRWPPGRSDYRFERTRGVMVER